MSFASEGKMRAEARGQVGHDNLVGETALFSFLESGGVQIKPAPFVYVPHLWDKIQAALEMNSREGYNCHACTCTLLTALQCSLELAV